MSDTTGWACSTKRRCSSASRMRSAHVIRACMRSCRSSPGWYATARSRPASLASYIAMSASTSSSSAVSFELASKGATPTLAVTVARRPPQADGSSERIAVSRPSATRIASVASARSSSTANSSPPSRASTSVRRSRLRSAVPTLAIRSSPAEWPSESLMYLKLSRSIASTAACEP